MHRHRPLRSGAREDDLSRHESASFQDLLASIERPAPHDSLPPPAQDPRAREEHDRYEAAERPEDHTAQRKLELLRDEHLRKRERDELSPSEQSGGATVGD